MPERCWSKFDAARTIRTRAKSIRPAAASSVERLQRARVFHGRDGIRTAAVSLVIEPGARSRALRSFPCQNVVEASSSPRCTPGRKMRRRRPAQTASGARGSAAYRAIPYRRASPVRPRDQAAVQPIQQVVAAVEAIAARLLVRRRLAQRHEAIRPLWRNLAGVDLMREIRLRQQTPAAPPTPGSRAPDRYRRRR